MHSLAKNSHYVAISGHLRLVCCVFKVCTHSTAVMVPYCAQCIVVEHNRAHTRYMHCARFNYYVLCIHQCDGEISHTPQHTNQNECSRNVRMCLGFNLRFQLPTAYNWPVTRERSQVTGQHTDAKRNRR